MKEEKNISMIMMIFSSINKEIKLRKSILKMLRLQLVLYLMLVIKLSLKRMEQWSFRTLTMKPLKSNNLKMIIDTFEEDQKVPKINNVRHMKPHITFNLQMEKLKNLITLNVIKFLNMNRNTKMINH